MNKILIHKLKEAVVSVLPITIIITIVNFLVKPMPTFDFVNFLLGSLLLIFGIALYSLGCERAIEPIGGFIGSDITKKKNLPLILFIGFFIGIVVTIAEPDLSVLASQVPSINKWALIITISVGVGLFLLLALLRIVFKLNLNVILIVCYTLVFVLAAFVPKSFVPLAFDSGGVTTGPITVPFILAFGISVSSALSRAGDEDNNFGMIGICSIGPILAVLLLALFFKPSEVVVDNGATYFSNFIDILKNYGISFANHLKDVGIALLPIFAVFILFQIFSIKLPKKTFSQIMVGGGYTYLGLTLFLTGVAVGFLPAGTYIGKALASVNKFLIIPVGMIVGASIIIAEPAVQVLNKQVEEITNGAITRKSMLIVLTVGMAVAVGLSMLRVALSISIWWIILPAYAIALILSFFAPKIFTAVAFDSGGVASGPMTASFLLPFAIGASTVIGGNMMTDAFGIVSFVAMTPLVAIQILGLYYKIRTMRVEKQATAKYKRFLQQEGSLIDFSN